MEIKPIRDAWKGTMSGRERFIEQMHYRSVDRTFNMEFGYWDENFSIWKGFIENGIRTNGQADRFFSFDPIHSLSAPVWLCPEFENKVIGTTDQFKIIQNESGLTAEIPLDGHSTIPHYTKSSIITPDDWKQVKEERLSPDHPARKVDIAALKARHPENRDYPLGIYCGSMIGRIRDMLTFEGLAYATYDYPEMVEDMVETACVLVEQSLDQLLPHFTFEYASGWEDIAFKNGPIVSIDFFENVVVPRYKRIHRKLTAHGIDLWYTDCDGDVRPLLPGFLDGGINCLFPFEVMGCAHPGQLLDQYEGELRIMGGIDKTKLIAGPAETRKYLESVAPYVEKGGYIPFCDHRCPPDVTWENYLYYLDLKESMFGMR